MNNKTLISTSMLNAYWEKEKKDTLDLLVPFVKYSIAKTTEIGCAVDVSNVAKYLRTDFGYDSIPHNVINLILNRLSPKVLKRENRNFILKVSLDEDINKYEVGHTKFAGQCAKVSEALKNYLNENVISGSFDDDTALQALISFFATNGICIAKDTELLESLKRKDDPVRYGIAQFILKESAIKSEVFGYIENMVRGFFVSMAITLQPQNTSVAKSKFKGLKCYIDTRIIIDALGLHLPEAKDAATEMLEMLKEKEAKLYCFEHNYLEIRDIISAYKHGLVNPHKNRSCLTLEAWDAQKYTPTDVERYQSLLKNKISSLGITIVDRPSIGDPTKYPFDNNGLATYIGDNLSYNNSDALETDVASVTSIFLLKDGNREREIEKGGAVFVTSNVQLANVVNTYLKKQGIYDSEELSPLIITDVDLSSIVWLKCCSTHSDYPKQRLIEHAITAIEPSYSILKAFFEVVDRIQSEGGITDDEAAIIRVDAFCRKELAERIKGNVDNITEQTVYDIKDQLRLRYIGDADKKIKLNYEKYKAEREEKRNTIVTALTKIKKYGNKVYDFWYKMLTGLVYAVFVLAILLFIILSVVDIWNAQNSFVAVILLAFGAMGTIDMICSKLNFTKKKIRKLCRRISDYFSDKKKEEYESILGNISYDEIE